MPTAMDTLLDDYAIGVRNYRRLERERRIALKVRQHYRRLEVENNPGADWFKVQTMRLIDGQQMEGFEEWMQKQHKK
jgi:hypothetical protein